MQKLHLKRTKRLLSGHLWIFSNEVFESLNRYTPGSMVEVYDRQENFLGVGYVNPNSLITVRLLSHEKVDIDSQFLRERIRSAIDLRNRLLPGREALRLIYSEGDYLPGLIVDRYGGCLVLQFLTSGMEVLREKVISVLDEELSPETIVIRNDSRSRGLEGLPLVKEVIRGSLERLPVVKDNGLLYEIDPMEGQKTGFFLDQKENRRRLSEIVKSGRGLDLFCYTGAWALSLAAAGAEVTGVDSSERAVQQARRNAGLNSLESRASFIKEDVMDFLRKGSEKPEKQYDFIVLDPPAFVKSAAKLREAVRAYREINALCMKMIRPGGILATSSCSYHLSRELFLDMLHSSSRDAGRDIRMLELRSQDMDHPVLLSMPETEYLKCAYLVVD